MTPLDVTPAVSLSARLLHAQSAFHLETIGSHYVYDLFMFFPPTVLELVLFFLLLSESHSLLV